MKNTWILILVFLFSMGIFSYILDEPAKCADGWSSPSIGRQGACSHHGGVVYGGSFWKWPISLCLTYFAFYIFVDVKNQTNKTPEDKIKISNEYKEKPFNNLKSANSENVKIDNVGFGHPICPDCSGSMVKRIAKQGKNKGGFFWGCVHYPNCTGTRNIEDS